MDSIEIFSHSNFIFKNCFARRLLSVIFAASSIIQAMDTTADPCQDFFQFACGGWVERNEIPDGKNIWGRFYELRNMVDKALKGRSLIRDQYYSKNIYRNSYF